MAVGQRRGRLHQTVRICNERGLHARAAAKFVQCASRYRADIVVIKDGQEVSGRSIMGLMLLAAAKGAALTVSARGPDAKAALLALGRLIRDKFGEEG
jgi:phosphocarrier protein